MTTDHPMLLTILPPGLRRGCLVVMAASSGLWLAACAQPPALPPAEAQPLPPVARAPLRPPVMPTKRPDPQAIASLPPDDQVTALAPDQSTVASVPANDAALIPSSPAPVPTLAPAVDSPTATARPAVPAAPPAPSRPAKPTPATGPVTGSGSNAPPPELALLPPDQGPAGPQPDNAPLLPATRPPASVSLRLELAPQIDLKSGSLPLTAHLVNDGKTAVPLTAPNVCEIADWDLHSISGELIAKKPPRICNEALAHARLDAGGSLMTTDTIQIDPAKLTAGMSYLLHYSFWGAESRSRISAN